MVQRLFRKEPTTVRTVAEALSGLNKALQDLEAVKKLQQEEAEKQRKISDEALQAEAAAAVEVEQAGRVLAKLQDLLCIGQ